MIDYDRKIADLKKKKKEKKKENDKKIAQKIGTKLVAKFWQEQKKSNKPLEDILGKKPTNSALVSYILSLYKYQSTTENKNDNNSTSNIDSEELEEFTFPEEKVTIPEDVEKELFAEKYQASDVLKYASIDEIIELGVILSRAIGRPADMAHVSKYFSNENSQKYIQALGIPVTEFQELGDPDSKEK